MQNIPDQTALSIENYAVSSIGNAVQDLCLEEQTQLEKCEATLRQGLQTFLEVGGALLLIRERRLYRSSFSTFEQYCQQRWNIGRTYASRLIGAARRVGLLVPGNNLPTPTSEGQIRPFLKLKAQAFPAAWKRTVEKAPYGKITPELIREVVNEFACNTLIIRKKKRKSDSRPKVCVGEVLLLLHEAKRLIEKGEGAVAVEVIDRIESALFGLSSELHETRRQAQ